MLKKLILTLSVLSFTACAFNNDESGSDNISKKITQDNIRAAENFRKVEGSYQGNLVRENGSTEVIQIALLLLTENSGINTDGSAKIQYKQAAAYTRVSPASAPVSGLSAAYTPETGTISISNNDDKATNDDLHSVIATIKDGIMTGVVKSKSGIIGRFSLKFIVGGSSNGGNGSEDQYYQRIRDQYQAISGTYLGCVIASKNMQSSVPSYKGKITLSTFEQEVDDGKDKTTRPLLVGTFSRNYNTSGLLKATLSGSYRNDFNPAILNLTGTYIGTTNSYATTFRGTLSANGEYIAEFASNKNGVEGQMYFKKGQTYPAKCANVSR
ncbi:hypothetical protein [Bdellovibrio sp. HCB209]|uniref:hypothetical protein n=1 Tax=Bdellovibrio sp. HCB209 TaxID=3394354 RepID=UPI0039B6474E